MTLNTKIDTSVASLKLFPGFNSKLLEAVSKNFHGIVIEAFGSGSAPFLESELLEEIERTIKKDVAVVVATQCPFGEVDMNMYETGKKLEDVGVISAKDMSSECAIVKLMFALGESKNIVGVRDFMNRDLGGGINV